MMPPLRLVRVRVVKITGMIIATGSGTNVSPRWVHASSALYFSIFVTRKGIMISATVTDLAPTLEEVEAEDAEMKMYRK